MAAVLNYQLRESSSKLVRLWVHKDTGVLNRDVIFGQRSLLSQCRVLAHDENKELEERKLSIEDLVRFAGLHCEIMSITQMPCVDYIGARRAFLALLASPHIMLESASIPLIMLAVAVMQSHNVYTGYDNSLRPSYLLRKILSNFNQRWHRDNITYTSAEVGWVIGQLAVLFDNPFEQDPVVHYVLEKVDNAANPESDDHRIVYAEQLLQRSMIHLHVNPVPHDKELTKDELQADLLKILRLFKPWAKLYQDFRVFCDSKFKDVQGKSTKRIMGRRQTHSRRVRDEIKKEAKLRRRLVREQRKADSDALIRAAIERLSQRKRLLDQAGLAVEPPPKRRLTQAQGVQGCDAGAGSSCLASSDPMLQ